MNSCISSMFSLSPCNEHMYREAVNGISAVRMFCAWTTKDVQRCGAASATSTGEIRYCIGYVGSVTFSQVFGDGSGRTKESGKWR